MPSPPQASLAAPGRKFRLAARWALGLYWIALFLATHWPRPPRIALGDGGDKIIHFGMFAALAFLVALNVRLHARFTWFAGLAIVAALAFYGAVDELLQPLFNRTCELNDWLADVAGALFGLGAFLLLDYLFTPSVRNRQP